MKAMNEQSQKQTPPWIDYSPEFCPDPRRPFWSEDDSGRVGYDWEGVENPEKLIHVVRWFYPQGIWSVPTHSPREKTQAEKNEEAFQKWLSQQEKKPASVNEAVRFGWFGHCAYARKEKE